MAIKKIQIRPEGTNNYGDVLYPETSASQVIEETDKRFMTDAERTKLTNLPANAQANTVTSVAGRTGAVVVSKTDVGLSSVLNYGLATTAEAQAGASAVKYMTPVLTKEAITAQAPSGLRYLQGFSGYVGGNLTLNISTLLPGAKHLKLVILSSDGISSNSFYISLYPEVADSYDLQTIKSYGSAVSAVKVVNNNKWELDDMSNDGEVSGVFDFYIQDSEVVMIASGSPDNFHTDFIQFYGYAELTGAITAIKLDITDLDDINYMLFGM